MTPPRVSPAGPLPRCAAALLLLGVLARGAHGAASTCGNVTVPPDATATANVLVIGDSISMAVPYTPGGYGVPLQALLRAKGVATQHAGGWFSGGQASNTPKGLLCTTADNYLNFTVRWGVGWVSHSTVTASAFPAWERARPPNCRQRANGNSARSLPPAWTREGCCAHKRPRPTPTPPPFPHRCPPQRLSRARSM